MRKWTLIYSTFIGLLFLFQFAPADTYVAGQVSGTWTVVGSPYQVLADIEIPYGQTLTIEPGVTVKFTGHFKFIAHGTLTAVGTSADSILITHHLPYPQYTWAGIYFEGTQGTSELSYCLIEWGYAQGVVGQPSAKGGGIHVFSTTVNVNHCRFSNNEADVKGAAIYYNIGAGEIAFNTVANNVSNWDGGGIFVESTPAISVHDNLVHYNTANDDGGGIQFVLSGGSIENNNIHHNTAQVWNGGGILCDYSSPLIKNNVINYNSSAGTNGSGVYLHHQSAPLLQYNEICRNNHSGVFCGDNCSPQLENNTVYGNAGYAITTYLASNPSGLNNIFAGNNSSFQVTGGCSVTMTYSDIQGGWPGIGNFDLQPFFVNPYGDDFHLLPYSPCIDAGSPISPLDPDGTAADQGAHYFDQNQPQGTCTITLTPFGSTVLPPGGGTIWYGVAVQNSPNFYNLFDGWITLQQPDLQIIPLILRTNIYLGPGGSLTRTISLTLSATAMPGTYTVIGYVGENPSVIEDFDSFTFLKQASDGYSGQGGTVTVSGWDANETIPLKSSLPQSTQLLGHYPEPFNPTTAISYQLSANNHVRLEVFDTAGRLVATLVDRSMAPGVHHETFDGSGLASGIYLYRLTAGDFSASGKMVLLK